MLLHSRRQLDCSDAFGEGESMSPTRLNGSPWPREGWKAIFRRGLPRGVFPATSERKGRPGAVRAGKEVPAGKRGPTGLRKAAGYFQQACDVGFMAACLNLGSMHGVGQGVDKDEKLAAQYFRTACVGGIPASCSSLGHLYVKGKGVAQDQARAVQLFRAACDDGILEACTQLGIHERIWKRCRPGLREGG
jgi:TPR repeat protein